MHIHIVTAQIEIQIFVTDCISSAGVHHLFVRLCMGCGLFMTGNVLVSIGITNRNRKILTWFLEVFLINMSVVCT